MPKLTQSFVKSLPPAAAGEQALYMDDELTGFGLRVSATKKVFYLQVRIGKKVPKRKLGEYGPMTVDQARKKALLLKAQWLEGKDPYAERERGPIDATLEELFLEYRNEVSHRPNTKKSIDAAIKHFGGHEGQAFKSKPDGRSHEMAEIVKVVLPNWLKRPYREITQDEVLARFDVASRMLAKRRRDGLPAPITRTINQHFKYLQAAYNYAISKHRLADVGFSNPVAILKTARRWSRMNRRSGFLDTTKPYFVRWWYACESLKPVVSDYILFTLITASRSIESATLRWSSDVDFKKNEVTFRDTKNGQSYTFPLAPLARTILERRYAARINDFVFGYAKSKTGHVACPPQYHIKLVRKACDHSWSMHDLRRTFTTTLTRLNVHAFTIAHLMKHSTNSSMTFSYAPPTREQLLEALTKLEDHLLEQVRPSASNDESVVSATVAA
ncbi:integrase family protein [Xanthomonas euvesicatoria]|uniref:integrase family protein n=1 Tax=Xanthomonas euvesicatoria TaxID=456327 RepID=UPI001C46CD2B|nr:integrase family protein [Xanthomonas euvesicatoria]MBV6776886.1 integrase family protein [Xanthomonas campestris pv. carissae]